MDTVPPYIPFSEDEEFLYGRGVCDAKGILAAQVAAAEALRAAGFRIGLLFVAGEERDSAGAMAANHGAQGQPLPHQRRADRQSPGAGLEGRFARGLQVHRQDGPLGLSRTGRKRRSQAGRGAGKAAGDAAGRAGRHWAQHAQHRPDSRRPRPQCHRRQGRGAGAGAHGDRLRRRCARS